MLNIRKPLVMTNILLLLAACNAQKAEQKSAESDEGQGVEDVPSLQGDDLNAALSRFETRGRAENDSQKSVDGGGSGSRVKGGSEQMYAMIDAEDAKLLYKILKVKEIEQEIVKTFLPASDAMGSDDDVISSPTPSKQYVKSIALPKAQLYCIRSEAGEDEVVVHVQASSSVYCEILYSSSIGKFSSLENKDGTITETHALSFKDTKSVAILKKAFGGQLPFKAKNTSVISEKNWIKFTASITYENEIVIDDPIIIDDPNQAEVLKRELEATHEKLNALNSADLSCSSAKECKTLETGSTPCGGPSGYVIFSQRNKAAKAGLLQELASSTTKLEAELNSLEESVGNCSLLSPPQVACQKKRCVEKTN